MRGLAGSKANIIFATNKSIFVETDVKFKNWWSRMKYFSIIVVLNNGICDGRKYL